MVERIHCLVLEVTIQTALEMETQVLKVLCKFINIIKAWEILK
jgi:hypothetical protein